LLPKLEPFEIPKLEPFEIPKLEPLRNQGSLTWRLLRRRYNRYGGRVVAPIQHGCHVSNAKPRSGETSGTAGAKKLTRVDVGYAPLCMINWFNCAHHEHSCHRGTMKIGAFVRVSNSAVLFAAQMSGLELRLISRNLRICVQIVPPWLDLVVDQLLPCYHMRI
jgi:hypothetical protein